jgi:hypothetical protein
VAVGQVCWVTLPVGRVCVLPSEMVTLPQVCLGRQAQAQLSSRTARVSPRWDCTALYHYIACKDTWTPSRCACQGQELIRQTRCACRLGPKAPGGRWHPLQQRRIVSL